MSQTASLLYVTVGSSTNDTTVDSIALNGTVVSGSPTLIEQGYPTGLPTIEYTGAATNIGSNNYFVTGFYGNTSGSGSTSVIFRETFGVTPNFTSSAVVASDSDPFSIISGVSVDSTNNILYYADGTALYADRFGSGFSGTPTQVKIATLPKTVDNAVYDAADKTIYAGGNSQTGSMSFTHSTVSFNANYIYKITNVTPTMAAGSGTLTSYTVPFTDGAVGDVAFDSANDTLYFTTQPVKAVTGDDVVGLYAMSSTGSITKIWSESGSSITSGLGFITSFTIDPTTGDYYLATEGSDKIFEGNVSSGAIPTVILTTNQTTSGESGKETVQGLAIVDPPGISSIAVSKVNGTTATTGNVTVNGTVTIAVTFSQAVVVAGTPTLTLNDGGSASYTSGSGGNVLLFTYTAASGQNTAGLAVTGVSTTAGTIKDAAGVTANLSTSTVTFNGVVVETTPLTLTLSSTGSEAVQGGTSIAALSGTPVIASGLGSLTSATIAISGYQSGDVLGINGATSGTLDSGRIFYSSSNGTLTLTGTDALSAYETALGELTYQDSGTDGSSGAHPTRTLSFHLTDGIETGSATSSITIDRAPSVVPGGFVASLVAGGSISGLALTGDSDPDGDSITISALSGGVVGTALSGTYGVLTLSANGNYSYSASNTAALAAAATGSTPMEHFTFTVSDGHGGTTQEVLAVAIDRAPSIAAGGASAALVAGGSVTGAALTGDSDPDGNSLTITALSGGSLGTGLSGTYGVLTLSANGSYSYSASNSAAIAAAATGSHPVDHFTFTVSDGAGASALETLNVTIDRAPVIVSGGATAALAAGGSVSGAALTGDSDPDGDSLTITALSGGALGTGLSGAYGVLTLNANGSYSYSASNSAAIAAAPTGSHPVDSFTFSVADGQGGISTETLAITIDRAPVIVSGGLTLSATEGATLSGTSGTALAGDTDPDGKPLSIGSVGTGGSFIAAGQSVAGTYGTLVLNADGSYSYTANNTSAIDAAPTGSTPVDQFTFTVTDGSNQALETLSIDVARLASFSLGNLIVYTPGGSPAAPLSAGTVTDPDGLPITGAEIFIGAGSLAGDTLGFTPQSGITGSFANGTLTLTGTASAAAYQAALQSVEYYSTAGDPYANGADSLRTIGVVLTDAEGSNSEPSAALVAIDPITIDIGAGSLTSLGTIGSTREITFLGTGSTLDLTSPSNFAGTINGFDGDTIDLSGISVASESFSGGTLTLFDGLGNVLDALTITEPSSITSADFHFADDTTGGTDLTLCFYPGTRIATPTGEVAVENLRDGDMVLTSTGPAPLRWVGRSEIATRFANKLRTLPIRITAGALGHSLPARDLLLSPDHALFLDNILIQAGALVNNTTIRREYDVPEHFTYYHLELDHHALLLAEGALAESFVDNVDRINFHNWNERTTPTTPIPELPHHRAKSARQIPAALRRRTGLSEVA